MCILALVDPPAGLRYAAGHARHRHRERTGRYAAGRRRLGHRHHGRADRRCRRCRARCPPEGASVIDAAGKIVVPGGIDPHTHLAHSIMSHPEDPARRWGPRTTRAAWPTAALPPTSTSPTCSRAPSIQEAIERRAARWKGNSHTDYAFHVTLCGALDLEVFDQIPDAIKAGLPELQGLHHQHPAAAPQAHGQHIDFGRIGFAMEKVAATWRDHGRPRRGRRPRAVQLRAVPRRRTDGRRQHASGPHQALRAARFRRTTALARAMAPPSTSSTPRRGGRRGHRRGSGAWASRSTARRCTSTLLQRRVLQEAARVLLPHLPSLKFPEDQRGALERPGARRAADPGHRRVPDLAGEEAARAGPSTTSPAATSAPKRAWASPGARAS